MLALRQAGSFGPAHVDFYQPEAEPKGKAAVMGLVLVVGRGPAGLPGIDQLRPCVRSSTRCSRASTTTPTAQAPVELPNAALG